MLQENLINVQAKIDAALARRTEEKITGNKVTLVALPTLLTLAFR